ncbi:MAG: hypothetical protein D6753_03695 [Planctomycetota bacterium]|nr:MAG: hypothetical protein D6753_03695 [Planctomycetota bacterium]
MTVVRPKFVGLKMQPGVELPQVANAPFPDAANAVDRFMLLRSLRLHCNALRGRKSTVWLGPRRGGSDRKDWREVGQAVCAFIVYSSGVISRTESPAWTAISIAAGRRRRKRE